MADNEYQYHYDGTCNDIVRTHAHRQAVEHPCKGYHRQSEGQTDVHTMTAIIAQQSGSHIVGIPKPEPDI